MENVPPDGKPNALPFAIARLSDKLAQLVQSRDDLFEQHVEATTTRNTLLQTLQDRLSAQDVRGSYAGSNSMSELESFQSPPIRQPRINIFDDVPHVTQILTQLTIDTQNAQRREFGVLQIVDELSVLLQEVVVAANTSTTSVQLPTTTSVTAVEPIASQDDASTHTVPDFVAAYYDKDEDARGYAGRLVHLQLDHEDDLVVRRTAHDAGQVIDPPSPEFEAIYQAQYESIRDALDKANAIADEWKRVCQEQGWNVDTDKPFRDISRATMEGVYEHAVVGEQSKVSNQSMGQTSRPETSAEVAAGSRSRHAIDIESISASRQGQNSPPPELKDKSRLEAWASQVEPVSQQDNNIAQSDPEAYYRFSETTSMVEPTISF